MLQLSHFSLRQRCVPTVYAMKLVDESELAAALDVTCQCLRLLEDIPGVFGFFGRTYHSSSGGDRLLAFDPVVTIYNTPLPLTLEYLGG